MDDTKHINPDSENFLSQPPSPNDLIVVGIGASAGGVQALKQFFENVHENSGIAYVVILHLSPDHDSKLAEVLQSATKLRVIQVMKKTTVKADHVYVVPPNKHLMMIDGDIAVSPNMELEDRRAPVDIFFRTLANSHGPRAVCVVLSGTGANGSMGLKRIKELGGAAFVQNPREAQFNEMPRNSISTDMVDEVLPVSQIPDKIIAYKRGLGLVHIPEEAEKRPEEQQHALREIFNQLRVRTGHDFTNYKRATLMRRIERRINVKGLPSLAGYSEFLQQNPEETTSLLKDLLISVTNFFRDKKPFELVEKEVLPAILKDKSPQQPMRIWVAGCATGEEAYSLAMLCAEQTMNVLDAPKVQIFATDIDENAIKQAREGLYSLNDAADVSPERLHQFFNKEGGNLYRVKREIREMILFVAHNFIKDPPFSHLDMISCRNVMIYLNSIAQERALETFHFGLKPSGFLLLGTSESADSASDLFVSYNRDRHLFQKRHIAAARNYPLPDSIPQIKIAAPRISGITEDVRLRSTEPVTYGELHQRLLEAYAPPSVIVNEAYDIVHISEGAGRYLQIAGGEPTKNLLKLVREGLRLELRSALYQSVQRGAAVESRGLQVTVDERTETINIHVRPVLKEGDSARGFVLILFERVADEERKSDIVVASDEPVARQLEEELSMLKLRLGASNEQHELHAEELKASNEELQAMNEELRSAAEELETSKEELQSMNEELRTVNQELKVKVEETTMVSNNLHNLINSADIGTIFLDRGFRVAFFTPPARQLFNLISSDFGRPLSDITGNLAYDGLIHDAETVLEKLQPVEREVSTKDERVFMMRVLPYRTSEDKINGVVITFFDVTALKKTEQALASSEERMRLLIESAKDYAIFTTDTERRINSWNTGAESMMGYSEQEVIGKSADIIYVPEDRENGQPENEIRKAFTEGVAGNERWHLRKDGTRFYGSGTVRPLYDKNNSILGFVKIMRDLTDEKRTEQTLRESEQRFRTIVSQTTAGICLVDLEGKLRLANKNLSDLLGYTAEELIGKSIWALTHADDLEKNRAFYEHLKHEGIPFQIEKRLVRKDGSHLWVNESFSLVRNDADQPESTVGVMVDMTERKRLEEQKDEFIGVASHELKTPVTSIKAYAQILQERFEQAGDMENSGLMKRLNAQVDRLTRLIGDLLDTTKISEGSLQLHRETFDLNDLITESIDDWKGVSDKHTFIFHKAKLQPVTADRERLGQVLSNLVMNAIKYSPDGGKVTIQTAAEGESIKVSIADEGIGIQEVSQRKIFERFFRADDNKVANIQGMGLGLFISAEIIKAHGGVLDVRSNPGEGSVFYFTINNGKPGK